MKILTRIIAYAAPVGVGFFFGYFVSTLNGNWKFLHYWWGDVALGIMIAGATIAVVAAVKLQHPEWKKWWGSYKLKP